MKTMKMRKSSVMQEMKEQEEKVEFFKECNKIPKIKLEKMRDVVNTNDVLAKRLENDTLGAKI